MLKKLKTISYFAISLCILILTACTDGDDVTVDAGESRTGRPTVDRLGLAIDIPEEMNEIIALAPSVVLTLIELGLEDHLIAIDSYSDFILGGKLGLPTIDMMNIEVESIMALSPDFIISSDMIMMGNIENNPLVSFKELGIGVAYIPSSETIADIGEDIRFIAAVTGQEALGKEIVTEMMDDIDEIRELAAQRGDIPTIYFEISPAPDMFSFGSGTFQNEMVEILGAVNIFADETGWIATEAESVVAANPDVIFTNVNFLDDPVEEILSRPGWEGISAVQNARVYEINSDDSSIPSHHLVRAIRAMADYLN